MISNEVVNKLAKELRVEHKIDPFEIEADAQPWIDTLNELKSLKWPNVPDVTNVCDVNAKLYFNVHGLKKKLYEELHAGYDFSEIKRLLNEFSTRPSFIRRDFAKKKALDTNELFTCFIVDAFWENTAQGSKVVLFTRDCYSDLTARVCVRFNDYFFIRLTDEVSASSLQKTLKGYDNFFKKQNFFEESTRPDERKLKDVETFVLSTELCYDLKSVYGFKGSEQTFLKVLTISPTITRLLYNFMNKKHPGVYEFFESNVDLVTKLFAACDLQACSSITVEHFDTKENQTSSCDVQIECGASSLTKSKKEVTFKGKMFYFDIECLSADINVFPTADCCPVIQISYMLCNGLEEESRGVLCLKETPGDINESFDNEEGLLIRFAQLVQEFNPDAVVGFNSNNFDMPYILDRMDALKIPWAKQFSRILRHETTYRRVFKQSNQFGTKEIVKYNVPGRIMFDFFEVIKADVTKKLRSYSLKNVCATYLGDNNKEDLRYSEIPALFETPEGRAKIASYCMKDTVLLLELDKKLMLAINMWGMTKALNVTADTALNRGLVHKLMCKFKCYTSQFGFLIPDFTKEQKPVFKGKYQGAFVLEPDIGFHESPVVVLDYASLYPSLMIYYNLSYDTFLPKGDAEADEWALLNPDKWTLMDNGERFVNPEVQFGLIPRLQQELAKQRKLAKAKKAKASNDLERAVYDGEQLAVKVIMNSLYGMLGSPTASVPCVEIASTITAMGRYNLMKAKEYVEANYCKFTREPPENAAKVIYGDTVSYFLNDVFYCVS